MDNRKDLTVFIGRFSPFHNGHAAVIERALKTSKAVLILVGSSGQARTTKNPFTFDERANMIRNFVLDQSDSEGKLPAAVRIKPLIDHPYNDNAWIRGVQNAVEETCNELISVVGLNPEVYLTGADRDRSTWYLNAFGNYFKDDLILDTTSGPFDLELNATALRSILFNVESKNPLEIISPSVPESTLEVLQDFTTGEAYLELIEEYKFIEGYKARWSVAPFPPTFLTVDACVIQSGHVLVNIRDNFPGRGLWALPGGFLEQDEKLVDGAVRELKEETSIELSDAQLYGSIKSKEIFDKPDRSLRGRTVTTCFLFKLNDTKKMPKIKPQKGEVRKTMWVPINEALKSSDKWFEDHHAMFSTMYGRIVD